MGAIPSAANAATLITVSMHMDLKVREPRTHVELGRSKNKIYLFLARGGTILWDQFDRALWETMMQNNPILG